MNGSDPGAARASHLKPVMLITGAAQGLGRALARAAAPHYRLALIDVQETRGRALADELRQRGTEVFFARADVANERDMRQIVERIQDRWQRLDVLINNAGLAAAGPFEALEPAAWEALWRVNVMGAVHGCRAALVPMKRQRSGYLVNIAALAGISAPPGMASYVASNAALIRLSEALAVELAGLGIQVSVVCPGLFDSGLAKNMPGTDPLSRARLAEDMARAADRVELIAANILKAMAKQPMYIFPQPEARLQWRRKRRNPLRFLRHMTALADRFRHHR